MKRLATMFLLLAISGSASAQTAPDRIETPPVSAVTVADGIEISYRVHGPAKGRPMLLVAGTGMQLIEWPPELIDGLVARGFRVITFDHRDAGQSTHFTRAGMPDWAAIFGAMATGGEPPLPYRAQDMAQDIVGLLDRLQIERADLLGLSGGATLAQLVALAHPDRVRSLALIAANSGNPAHPLPADPARMGAVPQPQPGWTAAQLIDRQIAVTKALAGRGTTLDERRTDELARATVARDADPFGFARQGAAMLVLGDLRARQATLHVPTIVIHGEDDPLISYRSGEEVAKTIADARFLLIPGMGHEVPPQHVAAIVEQVAQNAARPRKD
ncbi:alpha/beta fold hydrolase [Sphingomonas sp. RS6]